MKTLANFLLLFLFTGLSALNLYVDANRFFDENQNTILEINYQVPYKNLQFEQTPNGFEALLDVEFYLLKNDKVVYDYGFPNGIIVSNKYKTTSDNVFTDKITITLSKNFDIRIDFIDQKSNDSGSWQYEFQVLPPSSLLSDLELSNDVLADSTNYLQKFHREEQLFQIIPNHILNKNSTEYCFVYWEIYNPFAGEKVFTINKTLTFRDSIIFQEMENEKFSGLKKTKLEKIRISDLDDGLYEYNIQVMCDSLFDFRQDYFSIKSEKLKTKRIFRDLEDEFLLVSYFLSSDKTSSWPSLTKSGKLAFIDRFWNANDPQPETEENDFYEKVKERVNYCNQQFYHFNKGWKTDRGRIYIKHGAPDEIIKGNTGLNTKYTQKEYEIWKYRTKTNITFIFVDLQMNGNHKLIYSDGDDNENTYPNWESYLGTDFDPTVLE